MRIQSSAVTRPLRTPRGTGESDVQASEDYSAEIDAIFGENYEAADRAFWRTAVPIAVAATAIGAAMSASGSSGDLLGAATRGGFLGAVIGISGGAFVGSLASFNAAVSL